jgi:N-acetylornithine carbamoyltransferase
MMSQPNVLQTILDRLDPVVLRAWQGRSLFTTCDATAREIDTLCGLADWFQAADRTRVRTPLFPDQLLYALFFDQSTRTRSSWAGAAARLGAHPVIVDGTTTQVTHGETAEETGAMLGMNAHALGIRHDLIPGEGQRFMRDAGKGIADYLRAVRDDRVVPVVNLQCDVDHPTQILADLLWLRERFSGALAGRTLAVTWAYSPSYAKPLSVPQGLIMLMPRFGLHVKLAHPPGYELMPDCLERARQGAVEGDGRFEVVESMDAALAGADAVYPKSWGPPALMLERVEANRQGDHAGLRDIEQRALAKNREHTDWICDSRRMSLTRDGRALYMHCLPADIDAEVNRDVFTAARVDLARQAQKKVYAIMALLAAAKDPDGIRRVLARA